MPRNLHRRRVLTHKDFMDFGPAGPVKPKPARRARLPSKADVERARWAAFSPIKKDG